LHGDARQIGKRRADTRILDSIFVVLLLARVYVPASALDVVSNYTTPGGSVVQKMHFAALGLIFLYILKSVVPRTCRAQRSSNLRAEVKNVKIAAVVLLAAIVIVNACTILYGHSTPIAYSVDSLAVAAISALYLVELSQRMRETILGLLVVSMACNDVVAIGEFVTSVHVLPTANLGVFGPFRATAFLNHPLLVGLLNVTALPVLFATAWPARTKLAFSVLFLAAIFAAGARSATVVAVLLMLGCVGTMVFSSARRANVNPGPALIAYLTIVALLAAVIAVLFALGFLDRLQSGLVDNSSMARLKVYGLFALATPDEILWGMDFDRVMFAAQRVLGLSAIESSIVWYVLQYGIIGAALLVLALLNYIYFLARGRDGLVWLSALTFLIVASTNNTLSAKGPALTFVSALVLCCRCQPRAAVFRSKLISLKTPARAVRKSFPT
jgi:hypothetical protein